MNILNTRTSQPSGQSLARRAAAEQTFAANAVEALVRVYFWWFSFGYFSQKSGRQL